MLLDVFMKLRRPSRRIADALVLISSPLLSLYAAQQTDFSLLFGGVRGDIPVKYVLDVSLVIEILWIHCMPSVDRRVL